MSDSLCYTGIGVMSGTSGDGIDLCRVRFTGNLRTDIWQHQILESITVPYNDKWKAKLINFDSLSGYAIIRLHFEYSHLLGQLIRDFSTGHDVDFVASHGHTVFHKPQEGVTFQIGDGETIASYLTQPLITSMRNKDIALGGQGAPIVPFGEKRLFAKYDVCINLGGICNVTIGDLGYDVTPCNMALNQLAHAHDVNIEFDEDGLIARSGVVIDSMLRALNGLEFYKKSPPKSLSREWFLEYIQPIIDEHLQHHTASDLLRTFVEHITFQIAQTISKNKIQGPASNQMLNVLISGGGHFNTFLIETLKRQFKSSAINVKIDKIDKETTEYKEAVIMAFLGMHALLGKTNIASSGTGARMDSISGSIHWPPNWTQKCDIWK